MIFDALGMRCLVPPRFFKGKGKGKGKRSPQLNVDPAKKLWIGNIPEDANWKDLQALVDQALLRPACKKRSFSRPARVGGWRSSEGRAKVQEPLCREPLDGL